MVVMMEMAEAVRILIFYLLLPLAMLPLQMGFFFVVYQAQVGESSTNAGDNSQNNIVQILLTQPVVDITKGVVWTNRANDSDPLPVFSPATVGPVTFDGDAKTCGSDWSRALLIQMN